MSGKRSAPDIGWQMAEVGADQLPALPRRPTQGGDAAAHRPSMGRAIDADHLMTITQKRHEKPAAAAAELQDAQRAPPRCSLQPAAGREPDTTLCRGGGADIHSHKAPHRQCSTALASSAA